MSEAPFTDFERDPNEVGIHWDHFITDSASGPISLTSSPP